MKKLAVAVIHGMGAQGVKQTGDRASPTFSKALYKRIRRAVGPLAFDGAISWREIFWADILQDRQDTYLARIRRRTRYDDLRRFVVQNLGDAAAYRKTADLADNTYGTIHKRVDKVIRQLDQDTDESAPLVILAHSLGGHIMSNYIYDLGKAPDAHATAFRKLKTLAAFVTFGCNIPLFTFSYAPKRIIPITFPGTDLPQEKRLSPWWLNYYDKDDVLGYPLASVAPHYTAMAERGDLKDIAIDTGTALTSWNPMSHNAYWRDDDFYRPVAKLMKRLL
ncbi:hypothetical protein [Parvularcula sp. IMCC14364]|uniref:hypothetical protein n=1 Tax=Parvularcula sp. IMCC14364 TaxID=3067902 RepID=UPI00274167A2|nr:hypothetical protein [Parvularcula sp. IMCC14364]